MVIGEDRGRNKETKIKTSTGKENRREIGRDR